MKKILILLLLSSTALVAQERKQLKGMINSILKEPLEGITVFNASTLEGTVTNEDGVFYIDARTGDDLSFSAIQYDPFSLKVTEPTMDKGSLQLTFSEGVNLLEEVVVTDQNIVVRVKRTEMPDTGLEQVTERNIALPAVDRVENTFSDRVRQPEEMPLVKTAMNQTGLRYNSFNLVGLLGGLLLNGILNELDLNLDLGAKQKKEFEEVVLKNKYSTEYLVDYLDIPEENLYEFMVFAQEQGLNQSMLDKKNEMELLKFLDEQSTIFKARLAENKETAPATIKQ